MGKFITFEGGEGSGKTTHLESLADTLRGCGYKVQTAHDPGTAPVSLGIRPLLLDKKYNICREAELLMYLAARAELVDKVILPMLGHVDFVLCDRYFDSTAVYQGIIKGWERDFLEDMHETFSRNLIPDFTFLFDVDPVIGLGRSKGIELDEGRWEEMGVAVHAKINGAFMDRAELYNERIIVIDANQEIDDVFSELVSEFHREIFI